jgi:hypothetical protein
METIELTRKQLYEIIWSTPLSRLAKEYALSDNGFRKLCNRYDIPIPKNGYWSKLKFNKLVKKGKFNPIFGGIDKIILTIREAGSTINLDQTPLTIRTKEIENDPKAPLIVPDELTKPDILTIQTKQYWKGKISFASYREDNRIIHPIRVEKNNRERALRFMDTFTKLLRYRGHTISKQHGDECVLIDGIYIEIDLREASKRIPATTQYGSSQYIPTGEFIFKIGKYSGEKEWRDGKVKLEGMLAKIVAKLELVAQSEKEWKERSRIARLQREEEEKRLAEIKKRRDEEITKFNKLVALSEQQNKTLLIRQYIEAVKQKAINTNSLTPEKQEWINWATHKADWIDPLINAPDEILDSK